MSGITRQIDGGRFSMAVGPTNGKSATITVVPSTRALAIHSIVRTLVVILHRDSLNVDQISEESSHDCDEYSVHLLLFPARPGCLHAGTCRCAGQFAIGQFCPGKPAADDHLVPRSDLSMQPGYDGPRPGGSIDAQTLFRSALPGTLEGPWLSQFFWMPVQQGAYSTPQVLTPPLAGVDYSTSYADWLANMRGGGGGPTAAAGTPRWICTSRDLTRSLQLDVPLGFGYQHIMLALIHLLRLGIPRNPGLPIPPSNEADGLNGQLWELVARCTLAALTPVFWQKWQVHRRLRPEAYAGRVHNHINGAATYPIPTALLGSQALAATFSRYGTYLMPMAWKGGCPPHPSYPSAHAVIAAAGVTVLKAFFDGNAALPNPVLANADGTALVPYAGAPLTVEGELNKLAANIGISRVQTGIHFRSDSMQSIALGERMAINMLSELKPLRGGAFDNFTFRRFDGSLVTV